MHFIIIKSTIRVFLFKILIEHNQDTQNPFIKFYEYTQFSIVLGNTFPK
jgi:hypothetical protein